MSRNTAVPVLGILSLSKDALARAFFRLSILALLICLYPSSLLASAEWRTRPGTIAHTRTLPDRTAVTLDSMLVTRVVGGWIFVKDPWSGTDVLPVYVRANVQRWWSVEITGYTQTIRGRRVVVATRVRLYVCINDRPFIMMPKGMREPYDWPYMRDLTSPSGFGAMEDMPPLPGDEEPEEGPPTVPIEGTIAWAKNQAANSTVALPGKIVTAVFYASETRNVDYFYIEEPDRSSGIKVVWSSGTVVDVGDVVSVSGTMPSTQAEPYPEAYIDATDVQVTGFRAIPKPLGMPQRTTAGALNGLQPALYSNLVNAGHGLNAVGLRIRVCGEVTETGTGWCRIDDGSGLIQTTGSPPKKGIKVIFSPACPFVEDEYVSGITGILGAETVTVGSTEVPVPVLRVPNHEALRVKLDSPNPSSGSDWDNAYHTLQDAIDDAQAGQEVWVAEGTYDVSQYANNTVTLADGVALYGGFAGTETAREERDPIEHPTILDGNQSGSVVTASEVGPTTSIDGFVIRRGGGSPGGGIYCDNSDLRVVGNRIEDNNWSGIRCVNGSAPDIRGNSIARNAGNSGGINCISSSPTIVGNRIASNTASNVGGGVYCDSCPAVFISGNYIVGNTAEGYGGGIYLDSDDSYYAIISVFNNVISGNSAYEVYGLPGSGNGGGIYAANSDNGSTAIYNNTLVGNFAPSSGAIYCYNYWPSPAIIANNIVTANSSGIGCASSTDVALYYNCVSGNGTVPGDDYQGGPSHGSDIDDDPGLVSITYNDIHIQPNSPCKDAGDDTHAPSGTTDIDGQPRIQGAHVDIGADESDSTQWTEHHAIAYADWQHGDDSAEHDGRSWDNAKKSIKAALGVISLEGGEVWAKEGTYSETSSGDDETLVIPAFCYLYGGFLGTETQRSERDWGTNETIIDGDGQRTIARFLCGYHASCIDGFTLQNGEAYDDGGGIYCFYSGPSIANNCIKENHAQREGAGIFAEGCVDIVITANEFLDNEASGSGSGHGGAISFEYTPGALVTDNVFTDNTAGGVGGGAIQALSSSVTISGNIFTENTIANGWDDWGLVPAQGGAVLVRPWYVVGEVHTVITNNVFLDNAVLPDAYNGNAGQAGGAIAVIPPYDQNYTTSSVEITSNTFTSNSAGDYGGAVSLDTVDEATVVNNLFVGNSADGTGGGAVCARDCSPVLVNNTFVDNQATSEETGWGNGGGVLFWSPDYATVSGLSLNNIFYGNKAQNYGSSTSVGNSLACLGATPEADVLFCDSFSAQYYNTDAYHYSLPNGLSLGAGNEHANPLFVNAASDFHLQLPGQGIWSPIDKGHDAGSAPYDFVPATDLDGPPHSRPVQIPTVPDGSGGTTDMGCYEKQQ